MAIKPNDWGSHSCTPQTQSIKISGDSMEPLIPENKILSLFVNEYTLCSTEIKKGDIIAYQHQKNTPPFIKTIKATPGDQISFSNTTMFVNQSKVKNSINQIYSFTESEQHTIQILLDNSIVPPGYVLILGDNIKNSHDSRALGLVSIQKIQGRFSDLDQQ